MGKYRNFTTVVYIPAEVARRATSESLAADVAFLQKYIGIEKVYLETHRSGTDVPEEQLRMIMEHLTRQGIAVSGGITTTIDDFEGAEAGKARLFGTFCYTDPAMRDRLREISERTAKLFDEIILDDFFFTNCTCERCIRAKGQRDWVTFRRELMRDVSEKLVVGPAKAVNPKVRMIVKYPNWRESYHDTGYVPEVQRDIFDATYTGTETRSPAYTDQHLPEYLSYALVRYMENAWPGRNGGGWFDTYGCWSIDRYLEQAYLTAFAKAKELMHFQWSDLIGNPMVAPLGIRLREIDSLLDGLGDPRGIPVYLPFASSGENHLEMRLGMLGLPMEPTPFFPEKAARMLLTESALADPEIIGRLEAYVRAGGMAVVTSGFLRGAGDALRAAGLTEAVLTGRTITVERYQVTGNPAGYYEHCAPVLFPEIMHGNNDSWSLVNGGVGDAHASLLLRRAYGRGKIYIVAVPESDGMLDRIPCAVTDVLKRVLTGGEYVSGRGFSTFAYEDGTMLLYRYVRNEVRPETVTVRTRTKARALAEIGTGREIPLREERIFEDFEPATEYAADVALVPGGIRKYRFVP